MKDQTTFSIKKPPGDVLEEPSGDGRGFPDLGEWKDAIKQYKQALDNVLFDGFELTESGFDQLGNIITVSNKQVAIDFHDKLGITIWIHNQELGRDDEIKVKTLSDLCPYVELKHKH